MTENTIENELGLAIRAVLDAALLPRVDRRQKTIEHFAREAYSQWCVYAAVNKPKQSWLDRLRSRLGR